MPRSDRPDAPAIDPGSRPFSGAPVSLLRYSPALILFLAAVANSFQRAGGELWGHLLFGSGTLATHSLAHADSFSYSVPGHAWLQQEWLAEVAIAWAYGAGGVLGLKALKFGAALATVMFLALAAAETGAAPPIQLATILVAAMGIAPMFQFRPQLFDFVLLSALLWLLARDNFRGPRALWPAIPILWLWASLHGGFPVGFGALGLYAGAKFIDEARAGRGFAHSRRAAAVVLAAALATLANPCGFEVWYAPFHSAASPIVRGIVEWRPLAAVMLAGWRARGAGNIGYLLIVAMFAAFALAVAMRPSAGDAPMAWLAAILMAAALRSVRHSALALIAMAEPLARRAALIAAARQPRGGNRSAGVIAAAAPSRPGLLSQAIVAALAILVGVVKGEFSSRLPGPELPSGAVAFIAANALHGNLLSQQEWGNYLLWRLGGRGVRVFIDGRLELVYPTAVAQDYLDFIAGGATAARVLAAYPHDLVLVRRDGAADRAMIARTDWRPIYRDEIGALYARAGSPAARAPVAQGRAAPADFP